MSLDVMLARRAASERYPGGEETVRRWQEQVHRPAIYDLELDTSRLTPGECAAPITQSGPLGEAMARIASASR